jgi:hypothetical protein
VLIIFGVSAAFKYSEQTVVVKMAKKKNKKSTQKQGDAASVPESNPAPATATEESPAPGTTFEAQEQPLAPPLDTTNGKDPVEGSTSLTDQHPEVIPDRPSENEPSTVAASVNNSGTTQLFTSDHVSMGTGASNEEDVAAAAGIQEHVRTDENEAQQSSEETKHHTQNIPPEAQDSVLAPITAVDLTVPPQSSTLANSGPQSSLGESQSAELPISTVIEDALSVREHPHGDLSRIGEPLNVDLQDSTSCLDKVTPRESVVTEIEVPPQ